MVDPSRSVQATAIFAVNGSTAAAKVGNYVAMCDRGHEKGVAIGGRGGECFFLERDCNGSDM